jgi:hypothetical protein
MESNVDKSTWKFIRAERPDDPNRCQAIIRGGEQCPYLATGTHDPVTGQTVGVRYCPKHGGANGHDKTASIRQYMVAKWQAKLDLKEDHPKIKTLSAEIAVLRMLMEAVLERCDDQASLAMHAGRMIELAREINKLVISTAKLDILTKNVLDKNQAMQFIQEVVAIIGMHVTDESTLQKISEELDDLMSRQ